MFSCKTMTTQNMEKPKKKNWTKRLILGSAIFFFFTMIFALGDSGDNHSSQTQQASTQKQEESLDDFGAYLQGQYYVKQALKSPATAEFPQTDFLVNRLDDNRFEVVSYVDAQNSFGALLRTSWSVIFKYQNEKTYLEKMVLNGKVVYPAQGVSEETKQEIEKTQKMLDDLQKEINSYE